MLNKLKAYNPSEDFATLRLLVENFELHHSPLDHPTVHEERRCERCRLLKNAKVALSSLEAHRNEVISHLETMFG